MTEGSHTGPARIESRASDGPPTAAGIAPTIASPIVPVPCDVLPRTFGRYELRQLLGRGGMGRVYLAHDPQLDRLVALKMPNPVAVEGWRERFLTEARAAATLTHPNVCPVYEVGEENGQPYLTMAYIEGETLAAKLARDQTLDAGAAVALVSTVARAMQAAHLRGVVHRDLKPANLMIDTAGRPVIMDFGLAIRSTVADDLRLTLTGVALGTPAYMPPEQAGGDTDAIGPSADVYALGVVLYELVTGRVPFKGKPFGKLLAQIERDAPPRPNSLNPDVKLALEAIILTCLAKRPADRFASAGELADALDRYLDGDDRELLARYSKPFVVPSPTGEPQPAPAATTVAFRKPTRRWRWPVGLAVLLLAGGAAVVYMQTDYGELDVRLSNPSAKVDVRVNGLEVALTADGRVPRVRAGNGQKLEVSGPDFEPVNETFDLKRGGTTTVSVALVPKARAPSPAPLRTPTASETRPPRRPTAPGDAVGTIIVPLGGSRSFDLKTDKMLTGVTVEREEVLGVRPNSADPQKLILTGQMPGLVRLTVVFKDNTRVNYDVIVQPDLALLRNVIKRTVPTADVDVIPGIGNSLILTGFVTNQEDAETIMRIATSAVGGNASNVISTLKVDGKLPLPNDKK